MVLYCVKSQVDGLLSMFEVFTGSVPIKVISFLATLKDAFSVNRAWEAVACRVIPYYLEGESNDVYEAQRCLKTMSIPTKKRGLMWFMI